MTNEERDLITAFIARVAGASPAPSGQAWGSPSVPAIPAPPLPPIDPEADALLGALFQRYPEARYRLAQFAFVHEHALAAAQARIQQLEAQLRQPAPAPAHGGFFSGLFGGGRPAPPPGPPPGGYAPGYPGGAAPLGTLPRAGSGFLGSALTTAAGVAGGMVLGNALMNMFSSGPGATAAELPAGDPWSTPPDPGGDPGGWITPDPAADPAGWADPGTDPTADPDPGDGGWDPGGGDDTLI